MAEISVKVSLKDATEAQAGLAALAQATENLNLKQAEEATILSSLARLGEEHRAKIAERTAATQRLKDHTADLVKEFQRQEDAERAANSISSQLTSSLVGMAVRFAGAAFSVGTFVSVLGEIFSAGREADLALVKLDASLNATGGSVGRTSKQLVDLSEAFAKGTRFDATGIQQAMQVMLTFDNVTGSVFESAIRHAQNLSEKFGMDLTSAAMLVGRALQEPGHGLETLQRRIGTVNPELVKFIKNLDDTGQSMEARQEIIKLLDSRMQDFAKTVGESVPASFDIMKIAFHNLLEELGKGTSGGFWDRWAKNFDAMRSYITTFDEWRKLNTMRVITDELAQVEVGTARWKELNDLMQKLQNEARDKQEAESQAQVDAELAAVLKAYDEKEAKAKTHAEKLLKENEELTKKILADEERAVHARLEMMDLEVKQQTTTLEQKVALIDEEMKYWSQGTSIWITLSKERLQALDAIDKREDANIKNIIARYDVDVKMGRATYQQKLEFIDAQIAKETDGTAKWVELMRARQATEMEITRLVKQRSAEEQAALKKVQRQYADQADDQIANIKKTFYATQDLRLNALEQLAKAYQHMGEEGETAHDKVVKAMRNVETTAEKNTKRLESVMGEAGFDMINVIGGVNTAWTTAFADLLHGVTNFSGLVKALWKGIVDAVIQEIARMVARWLLAQAEMAAASAFGGFFGGFGAAIGGFFGGGGGGGTAATFASGLAIAGTGGEFIASSPMNFLVGEGGVAMRSFATGGEGIFTRPTIFRAGEGGPERVRVTPLAGGAAAGSGSGVTNVFVGPNVMDAFSLRRFVRQQEKLISEEARRRG